MYLSISGGSSRSSVFHMQISPISETDTRTSFSSILPTLIALMINGYYSDEMRVLMSVLLLTDSVPPPVLAALSLVNVLIGSLKGELIVSSV